jgi:hypothetical protein
MVVVVQLMYIMLDEHGVMNMNMNDQVQLMMRGVVGDVYHLYSTIIMDRNYLHDRMNRLNKSNSMISIDNNELVILYDHQLLNVNVNDRIH